LATKKTPRLYKSKNGGEKSKGNSPGKIGGTKNLIRKPGTWGGGWVAQRKKTNYNANKKKGFIQRDGGGAKGRWDRKTEAIRKGKPNGALERAFTGREKKAQG